MIFRLLALGFSPCVCQSQRAIFDPKPATSSTSFPFSNYTMGTTDRRDVRTSDPSEFEIRRAELVGQIGNVRPVISKDADLFYINASTMFWMYWPMELICFLVTRTSARTDQRPES